MSQSSTRTQIVDESQLTNVLTELQVGIRKISMYGFSHSIVPKIAQNLNEKLSAILETAECLPLVIGKNELLYQKASIAPGNTVIQELSQGLHRLNIIQITFKTGLTDEGILKFLTFILENRAKTFTQGDPLVAQFHEAVPSISLQLVTFKDAITHSGATQRESHNGNLWQNLLNRSDGPALPEEVRRLIDADPDSTPGTEAVASAINALYAETGLEKETYETTILDFLKRQTPSEGKHAISAANSGQDLGEIFSKLRTDVREQVFRLSMQAQDDHVMPLEDFLSHIPPTLLPDVLGQMDLSEGQVAPPTFRMLKKMAALAEKDDPLKTEMAAKLQDHPALRDELLPEKMKDKAGGENVCIQDFSKKMAYTEDKAFSDAKTDHHLSLILLEMLEQTMSSENESERCANILRDLLAQGIGEDTLVILMKTIQALLKNVGTDAETDNVFWRTQLKTMLSPEIVLQILKMQQSLEGGADALISDLVSTAGEDLFRSIFHVLEEAAHLSTRKQAIRFLIGCGPAIIPQTVSQLKNPKWFVVRNMLVILKEVKATDEVAAVISCMKHRAEQVRLAALQTLEVIAPETDLHLDALGTALYDQDENVSKTAIAMLVSSHHAKATAFVTNLFLQAEQEGKWLVQQVLLLQEMEKNGSAIWLPMLLNFRKGILFFFLHWGRQSRAQKTIRKTIAAIEKRVESRQ